MARSVARTELSHDSLQRWFERCGIHSRAAEMVMLIGVPSADRKVVAFLLDDAGRIAAVLKMGLTASGGRSLLHEAETLLRLEPHVWAPKRIAAFPDLNAAAQQYVPGSI